MAFVKLAPSHRVGECMNFTAASWFELAGGLFGAVVAYFLIELGSWTAGRMGIFVALVVGVPIGVLLGWLLSKLLTFIQRIANE